MSPTHKLVQRLRSLASAFDIAKLEIRTAPQPGLRAEAWRRWMGFFRRRKFVHFLQVGRWFQGLQNFLVKEKFRRLTKEKHLKKKTNSMTLGFLKKFIFPWCRFLKGTLVVGFGGESSLIFTKGRKINPHGIHWKMGTTQMKGYCWRNPAPVGRQFIPLFTRFIHSRWCRMSSINSIKQAA